MNLIKNDHPKAVIFAENAAGGFAHRPPFAFGSWVSGPRPPPVIQKLAENTILDHNTSEALPPPFQNSFARHWL